MANCPGPCPQLTKPTWCTVRDDPECENASEPCILIRNYLQSGASAKFSAMVFLGEAAGREYLARVEEWADTVLRAKGGRLDTRQMPTPEKRSR